MGRRAGAGLRGFGDSTKAEVASVGVMVVCDNTMNVDI